MTRAEKQRLWRQKPRRCACGRAMGVRMESGAQWVCGDCWEIEQRNLAARIKFTNRVRVNMPIYDEYRLCLP
jgi:hypothetical protein